MGFMILDLETENHVHHGDLASPFHPENYIVAPAFAVDTGPVQDWYFTSREGADASDWFTVPDNVQFIVAHNLQFELLWLLHRHRAELEKFLRRGGRVICTQLAEYMLSNMTEVYPSLDETAPKYGGTTKIDAVKVLWEQGYKTSQIDKAVLLEYLSGPGGDIENTRKVCFGQIPLLQERGMWDVYLVRCEALLYSAYCKFFGMKVDTELAKTDGDALAETITALRAKLQPELLKHLPEVYHEQFNWGSDFHVSALLFGGPIKLKVKVPYDPPKYEKVDAYELLTGGYVAAVDVGGDDWDQHVVKYKLGKNKGQPKVFQIDSTTQKLKWGELVLHLHGIVDLTKLPKAVADDFLDPRGEFRGKRYLCDAVEDAAGRVVSGTPVYSSSSDALNAIKPYTDSPLPGLLLDLADAEKIHGTYYVGMMKDVGPDGFLRRGINHVSTVTGRLSSGLQQMPRGGDVKRMFCSRFPGGNITEVDYTALEVVHLATLSGDKELLRYLQAGTDMHCLRLSAKLKRSYEEVRAIYKDEAHPEHQSIADGRQAMKPQAFQYQYGGTAQGMAYKIGITVEEAEEFIQNELKLFPQSSAYRYAVQEAVEGQAETGPIYREQFDDGSWQVYRRGVYVGPSGTQFSFRQYPRYEWINGKKTKVMQFKLPQLANYPCQGEASLVTQVACGLVIRWLLSQNFYDDRVLPISTVHDALYLDSHPELTDPASRHTATLMEYAPKYMAELFPAYKTLGIQDIPYPAVAEYGSNMKDKHHMENV